MNINKTAAIIMSGGRGERLRPITDTLPKPLVPIGDRRAVDSSLFSAKDIGIEAVTLTVRYKSDTVKQTLGNSRNGVSLRYFTETADLGTAGGVRAALDEIKDYEEAVILSGDTVSDIRLRDAVNFHRIKNAAATLILYESDEPQKYGVVTLDCDGKIENFREKPKDAEAGSLINAGIYILSRRVIERIPRGVAYDFGHELFPSLLHTGEVLYGIKGIGYWCDIGSPEAYIKCCHDAASGKISGLRTDVSSYGAIIGQNCAVAEGCDLHGCILHDGVSVGYDVRAKNAVFCRGVTIGSRVTVGDGAVIGADSYIEDGVRIPSGALISPSSHVTPAVFAENL